MGVRTLNDPLSTDGSFYRGHAEPDLLRDILHITKYRIKGDTHTHTKQICKAFIPFTLGETKLWPGQALQNTSSFFSYCNL